MEEKRLLVFTLLIIALSFLYANLDGEIGVTGFAVKENVAIICNFVGYPVGINDAYEKPSTTYNNECLIKAANISCKGLGSTCTLRKQKIKRGTYTIEAPDCKSAAVSFKVSSKIKKVSVHFSKCGEVKEKVTCDFLSGDSIDKCYYRTSSNNLGACENKGGRCSITLTEKEVSLNSTEILWTGCNSYTFTNFDGNNEKIKLHCKNKNKCIDNEYRLTRINNIGVYSAIEKCKNNIWEDYNLTPSAPPPPQVPPKAGATLFKLDPSGDDKYWLSFNNRESKSYTFPYISNERGVFRFGDGDDELVFVEGKLLLTNNRTIDFSPNIGVDDYFVLSDLSKGITRIVRYDGIDTASSQILFDDLAVGSRMFTYKEVNTNISIIGKVNLTFGGSTFVAYIENETHANHTGGTRAGRYRLAVDMNADGNINSEEVKIYVRDGITLDLGDSKGSGNGLTLSGKDSQPLTIASDEEDIQIIHIVTRPEKELGISLDNLILKDYGNNHYYWYNNKYLMDIFKPSTGSENSANLLFSLLSSKEVGPRIPERIIDTLEEGEEKTYTLSGKSLKLEVLIIEDTSPEVVVFRINGVLTGSLDEGDKKTLDNGAVIEVIDLINNDAGESGSGDLVKFALTY